MGRQILVKLLRLLRPEAKPDDVAEIVEALLRAEMRDAKSDVILISDRVGIIEGLWYNTLG